MNTKNIGLALWRSDDEGDSAKHRANSELRNIAATPVAKW